jgi:type VI secretion system protein ImpE
LEVAATNATKKAEELLAENDLQAAIQELTGLVKASPTDVRVRTFLFELLVFAGDWDRAERQLDVISQQSVKTEVGVEVYRNNIKAERDRARLFSHGLQPHFLSEPPAYVDLHLETINRIREGNGPQARALLDRAEQDRPALPGRLNETPFVDFRDYNDLIAPVLELIIANKYTWIPLERIKKLEMGAPTQLRDLIWVAARLETIDGVIGEAFIPALYTGSNRHPDDRVKLGRMTDWSEIAEGLYAGAGLRLFLVDDSDRPMLEARTIEFGDLGRIN